MKKLLPLMILIPFTIFSAELAYEGGLSGLAALRSPWAMQVFCDLCIALFIVGGWMRRDARKLGISATPFLIATPFLGSIAVLAYLVRRSSLRANHEARTQRLGLGA